jgi:hypothetical protein
MCCRYLDSYMFSAPGAGIPQSEIPKCAISKKQEMVLRDTGACGSDTYFPNDRRYPIAFNAFTRSSGHRSAPSWLWLPIESAPNYRHPYGLFSHVKKSLNYMIRLKCITESFIPDLRPNSETVTSLFASALVSFQSTPLGIKTSPVVSFFNAQFFPYANGGT